MLKFEATQTSYAIEIDEHRFLDLLDSESYVTENAAYNNGNETLFKKLNDLPGIFDIDYNGHFGSAVYLKIDIDDDTDELKAQISNIIEKHLKWCSKLKKRDNVVKRRNEERNET